MKSTTINVPSLAMGVVLPLIVLLAWGGGHPQAPARPSELVTVPDPRDMVVVREGVPLSVPADKVFVLTALGTTHTPPQQQGCYSVLVELLVDGRREMLTSPPWTVYPDDPTTMHAQFFVVHGPSKVEVNYPYGASCPPGEGRAWGLLVRKDSDADWLYLGAGATIRNPRDSVIIDQGTPWRVPQGKLFVLTGLGDDSSNGAEVDAASLSVDGVQEIETWYGPPHGSWKPVPCGFTAFGGEIVEVFSSQPAAARAWGYLVDAKPTVLPKR